MQPNVATHPVLSMTALAAVLFSTSFGVASALFRAKNERQAAEERIRAEVRQSLRRTR